MNREEKEQWLYDEYKYTSNFDFNRLDKYEEANDDICIDDLILDYTMLYELYKEEMERLNEIEKCIKDKYYEAIDYQIKIRRSDLMQGDYPPSYYLSEQNEQLCDYFLNRLNDIRTKRE